YEAGEVRFGIEEAFKGITEKEVTVFVDTMKKTSCEWPGYRQGERILIFAFEHEGKLSVGPCNPSKHISAVQSDDEESLAKSKLFYRKYGSWDATYGLRFLRSRPQNGGTLSVRVKMERNEEPVSGVPFVIAINDKQRYGAVTNGDGECEFVGLKPGNYTVTADWPKGYAGDHDPEIEVSEQGCSELEVHSYFSGRINGRIVDGRGQPAPFVQVFVSSANPRQDKVHEETTSDENGEFGITDLTAGQYYLHFDSESNDKWKYYYPGVSDKKKAEVITLGTGETSEGLEFKLPSTFETQTVKGKVVWPDGKPAAEATVYLKCAVRPRSHDVPIKLAGPKAQTDEQGGFVIQGFNGVNYRIEAFARTGDPNVPGTRDEVYSAPLRLTLDDDVVEMTLTLSQSGARSNCDEEKKRQNRN
ncbi:MAG TPA: carboxypeptidase-like regulatory domain-containing protein, partial [Blastocatellia bacterium]|nr:carboxypeptidase-like regulatory domain-containing protein [Blastocatellia bacterium]